MRHNKHSIETIESCFLGTISAFSIQNHHDTMEERAVEENEVVEKDGERKGERMGSKAMESSAHLADLAYQVPISPAQHQSRLPTSLISPAQRRSLFYLSFFFSFFLHSSPISPEFFFCGYGLIFLAWVVVGFIFVVVGWLWDWNFWLWLVFFFLG